MLLERFGRYKYRNLSFNFLFLPFASVEDFRLAFYREILGVDLGREDS
jgi:hypothetical protein